MKRLRITSITVALLLFSATKASLAGGLFLNEFGTPSMGTAGAGAQAWGDDASTAFHNPAGLTRIDGREFMLTGGVFNSRVKFDLASSPISGGDGGNAGGWAPMGGLFYAHSLDEKFAFGFNMFSISGAALDYDNDWAGRFFVQDITLLTLTFNPSLAYKMTDELSVAAGFGAMYGSLEMDVGLPGGPLPGPGTATIDGDDWAYGYSFSTLYELSEKTRLGALYWSEVELELSGDVEVSGAGTVGSDTTIPLAQWIKCGIFHELNDKWALLGTVGWEDWSTMDNLLISTESGSVSIPRRWHDTWHYAGGIHYRPADKWLLQAGISYDTSPVDSDDRTPDMPIDRQVRYAIGAQYQKSKTFKIGVALEYIDLGDAKINRPLFKGDYEDNQIFVLGAYANWKY
jgi:long-chain fatty acid transport protein